MNNNGRDQKLIETGGANGIDTAVIDPNNIERSSSSTSSDDDPTNDLKIQAADMPTAIQKSAMQSTIHALRTYTTEKHIAESIKQNFDQLHEPTWHCIVGRNWGSCVTHTKVSIPRSDSILNLIYNIVSFLPLSLSLSLSLVAYKVKLYPNAL